MYLDMDDGCRWNISDIYALLDASGSTFALPHAKPFGFSNWVMITVPNEPFFAYLVQALRTSNRSYGLPYLTVLKSAGPLFVSRSLEEYRAVQAEQQQTVPILELTVAQTDQQMFHRTYGSTWHSVDGVIIWNTYKHRYEIVVFCVCFLFLSIVYYKKYYRRQPCKSNLSFGSNSLFLPLLSKADSS